MFKLIAFGLGLAIGFGGGVWWSVKNPEAASKLSAEEERHVLEAKIAATKAVKDKLDQIAAKKTSSTPGAGFASSIPGSGDHDPDCAALRAEQEQQLKDLEKQLASLGSKK